MSTNYPTSIDSPTNPTSENSLNSPSHSGQHAFENDAIVALETKVGVDGSAVTTTHSYKLGEVTGTDKAVGKTATQTLTNKTFTSPVINVTSDATGDTYYRNSGGLFTRLPIGSSGDIYSVSGGVPTWIPNPSAANASTTVKGVVEMATQADVDARTTTGGTGALLSINPQQLRSTLYHDGATDSVGTDAYAISPTPAVTAYQTHDEYTFIAGTANTGAASLNVSSLGAKTIKKNYNQDLETGDILAGQEVKVVYDGTNMQLVSVPSLYFRKTANGVTSRAGDTATGSQTIAHGLGMTPKFVRIMANWNVSSGGGGVSSSTGVYNGSTTATIYVGENAGGSTVAGTDSTNIIYMSDSSGGNLLTQVATVTVDGTNITLSWTRSGSTPSTTINIIWEAWS